MEDGSLGKIADGGGMVIELLGPGGRPCRLALPCVGRPVYFFLGRPHLIFEAGVVPAAPTIYPYEELDKRFVERNGWWFLGKI